MHALLGVIAANKILAGIVAGGLVLGGGAAAVAVTTNARGPQDAAVVRVIDGDTIAVTVSGQERRVRLLNVDTPETVHPDETVECLGPEAAGFLSDLLPPGTQVRLEYDVERQDRYGRDLAGVFLDEDLVNAEIARAGLGVAVLFEPNDRFHRQVLDAQAEARNAGRGLYDPTIGCTLPAHVQAVETLTEAAIAQNPGAGAALAELEAHKARLTDVAAAGVVLAETFTGDRNVLPLLAHVGDGSLRSRVSSVGTTLARERTAIDEAIRAEQARLEAERLEAERLEAERLEAERLAAEEAARRAAQQRAAAEAARQPSSGSGSSSGSTSSGAGSSGSSGGGYDGYTGCRAYGGGYTPNAIDEKGRPYTKIDCTTKVPIG